MQAAEKLICAKEVAALLGVTERTAARMMRLGEIAAFKLHGAIWRTTRQHVIDYVLGEIHAGRPVCESRVR